VSTNAERDESFVPVNSDELKQIYCDFYQQLFTCALVITFVPARAEDAVHEAFCRLLGSRSKPTDLKAYVFRAVRNAARDQVRRNRSPGEPLPDFIFDPTPQPDTSAEAAEFKQRIMKLMQRLSADERETIVQHLYGDLTFQQIATVRELPLGTVVSWYRRGLAKLRRELEVADGRV
jgi:RNA polymerase sigma factor (sigma-70 family)